MSKITIEVDERLWVHLCGHIEYWRGNHMVLSAFGLSCAIGDIAQAALAVVKTHSRNEIAAAPSGAAATGVEK